jgi:hypothetical protein
MRLNKLASYAVGQLSASEIPPADLNIPYRPYASSAKTSCFIAGKGGKEHEGEMYFMR